MLTIMYWGDDDERKKQRVSDKLSKKRAKRKGTLPDNAGVSDSEETRVQLEAQSQEIKGLQNLILKQAQLLEKILEKQDSRYEVVYKPSAEEIRLQETVEDLPKLQDLDINIIKTEGIETSGKAGSMTQGQSVKDRASRLRELKKRSKNNDTE